MPRKRVSINISLPDKEFKRKLLEHSKEHDESPSEEFAALYRRKFRKAK